VGGIGAVAVVGEVEGLAATGAEVEGPGEGAEAGGAGDPDANLASSALSAIALILCQLQSPY
jgi:hypothetical protein